MWSVCDLATLLLQSVRRYNGLSSAYPTLKSDHTKKKRAFARDERNLPQFYEV